MPNHPGKRTLLRLLLRAAAFARPRPFAWRMESGALLAISPAEGLSFASYALRHDGREVAEVGADVEGRVARSQQLPDRWLDMLQDWARGVARRALIDVEGHEVAVIRRALQTLVESRPAILFEYSQSLARHGGWTLVELGEMIASCGDYRFFDIRDDGLREIPDLAAYAPESGRYGADLLAVPDGERPTGRGGGG